jgi:hypothetical protein
MQNHYPEHDKMRNVKDHSQTIGEFLDWMKNEKGFAICEVEQTYGRWTRTTQTTEQLLAEFFEIDLAKIQDEKDHMLAEMRESQASK